MLAIRVHKRISAGLTACCLATGGAAADPVPPGLWARVSVELEHETVFAAQDSALEISDTFATVEGSLGFAVDDTKGLRATVILEPVTDPEGDRFFGGFGLYAEELYAYGSLGAVSVTAGKFNPWFGLAADYTPGLYGDDLASGYELTERLGGAISVPVPVPFMGAQAKHDLTVSIFMADRTPLSKTLFNSGGQSNAPGGGPSDTDYPNSAAAALTGRSGGTIYNLAARFQAADAGGKDETGLIAGIVRETEIAGAETLLFGEVGHFRNFDGEPGPMTIATSAAEVTLGPAALSAVLGISDAPGAPAARLAAISLAFEIADGLTAEAGYRFLNDEGIARHSAGILLSYEFKLN